MAPSPWRRLGRRAAPLATLVLAVLGVHGLLLAGCSAGWSAGWSAQATPAARVLSVRHIVQPVEAPPAAAPLAPAPATNVATFAATDAATAPLAPRPPAATRRSPPPHAAAAVDPSPVAATAAEWPAPPAAPAAAPTPIDPPTLAAPEEPPLQLAAATTASPSSPSVAEPPPTYRTRVPPSTLLLYELRRGALTGEGELRWQRGADAYEMAIEGSVFGFQVLSQASRGGFDAAGLAPLRFVDRRRGRDVLAANFQRDRGLITYSGSSAEYPLLAGAQDRLSWMVQLAAIVEADPARWRPGQHVEMLVTGSRGDADVWTFTVTGRDAVDIVGARLDRTLALRREPRKPYDTRVEIWLDPGRHHLPARIRLSSDRGGDALEFVLRP